MDQWCEVAVVGRGLLGSAAARHLADLGVEVVLIGPGEPADRSTHDGVFASHYDSGRITRITDRDPYYARIAAASIAGHRRLESRTGIEFFHPVGHLAVAPDGPYLRSLLAVVDEIGVDHEILDEHRLAARFPQLAFAAGQIGLHERRTGGWIDPRRFIEAQGRALVDRGGVVVDGPVTAIDLVGDRVEIVGPLGRAVADRVLVATGAFANHRRLLPRPVDMEIDEHTVVLAEVDDSTRRRLDGMPSVINKRGDGIGQSIYLMPPIRYPDGRWWVKIGQSVGRPMGEPDERLVPWYRGTGDPDIADWLRDELRTLVPEIGKRWAGATVRTESCTVSRSPTGRQYIDRFDDWPVYGLFAGNGQVAKSADELGRIAAHRLVDGRVPPEYRDEDYNLRFADEVMP